MADTTDETEHAGRLAVGTPGPVLRFMQGRGFRWLYVLDALAIFVTMVAVNVVRFGFDWPDVSTTTWFAGFFAGVGVHLVVYYFGGLYEREYALGQRPWFARIAWLTALGTATSLFVAWATGRYPVPRGNAVFVAAFATLLVTANRHLSRFLRSQRFGPPRVVLVGNPDDIALARAHLNESDRAARIVGETTETKHLADLVERTVASDVLLLSDNSLAEAYPLTLQEIETEFRGIYVRVSARETLLGLQRVRQIAGMPFVTLRPHQLPPSRARLKRYVELTMLVVGLPVWLPVLALTAVYVRIVCGSPVLFRQERSGRYGKPFTMIKFRTMYVDAEAERGPQLAARDDERIIPACRWLRRARLDEQPQVWNIIRGQMSLVGPRPERPELTAQFEQLIPGYARRHEIAPGLTGLAQVRGDYHTDPEYKLGHDIQYLVNWTPLLDLQILARTVWVVLTGRPG